MRKLSSLPVAWIDGESRLISAGGRPVWPLCDEADGDALAALAETFGSHLRAVAPAPGGGRVRTDAVAVFDDEAVPAAALYAHLTERRLVRVQSLTALQEAAVVAGTVSVGGPGHAQTRAGHGYKTFNAAKAAEFFANNPAHWDSMLDAMTAQDKPKAVQLGRKAGLKPDQVLTLMEHPWATARMSAITKDMGKGSAFAVRPQMCW